MRVSYSAISTYNDCGEKYRLERIEKLTPYEIPAPFVIGSVFDKVSGILFDSFKEGATQVSLESLISTLNTEFEFYSDGKDSEGNEIKIHTILSDKIKFPKSDIDLTLLKESDYPLIHNLANNYGVLKVTANLDDISAFVDIVQGSDYEVNYDYYRLYKHISYIAVLRKLEVMIEHLYKWTVENVEKVISTQREIRQLDENGNEFVGYIDVELILKGEDFVRTMDVKTARNPKQQYPDNYIDESLQLHLYANWSNSKIGYIVINKNIPKKESTRSSNMVRILLGDATDEGIEDALEYVNESIEKISQGIYEKNFDNCTKYGGCTYYDICHGKEVIIE